MAREQTSPGHYCQRKNVNSRSAKITEVYNKPCEIEIIILIVQMWKEKVKKHTQNHTIGKCQGVELMLLMRVIRLKGWVGGCFPSRLEQGVSSGKRLTNTQLQGCWESKKLSGHFKLLYAKVSDGADSAESLGSGVRRTRTLPVTMR